MKKRVRYFSWMLAAALVFVGMCLPISAAEAAENPIYNPSFEEGTADSVPTGWTKSGGDDVTACVSSAESRTGSQSLYISAADGKSAGARSTATAITENDCVYVAEMYAKGTGTVYIYLEAWVGSPTLSATATRVVAEFVGVTCTDTWQKVIAAVHVPNTADHITILPYKQSFTAGAASVYCDDIALFKQTDYPLFLLDEIEKAAAANDADAVWSLMNTASVSGKTDLALTGLNFSYKAQYTEAIAAAGELTVSSLQTLISTVNDELYQEENSSVFHFDMIKGANESPVLITENLALPQSVDGIDVTWTSDVPEVISDSGEVTRPAYGMDPVFVNITGTRTDGISDAVGVLVAPVGMEENRMLAVTNSDIEEAAAEDVPGFSSYYGEVSYPQIGSHAASARTAFTGETSLMLSTAVGVSAPAYAPTGAVDHSDVRLRYAKVFTDTILNVYAGRSYTAGVMLKTPYDAEITLKFYNIRTHECGSTTVVSSKTDGSWRYAPVSAMAPTGAIYARILVEVLGAGDAYLDSLHMYEKPILKNASLSYGTAGWTEENGMLCSDPAEVLSDMEHEISATATAAGTLTLEFLNAAGTVLWEETSSALAGETVRVRAFAPSLTQSLRVKATAGAFSAFYVTPVPYGAQVPDGDFSASREGADTWKSNNSVVSETPFWSDSLEGIPDNADTWTTYNAQTAIAYTNEGSSDGNSAMWIQVTGSQVNGGAVSPVFAGTAGETVSLDFQLLSATHGNIQVYLSTSTDGSSWSNTRLDSGNISSSAAWQSISYVTSATKAYNRFLILFGLSGATDVPRTMLVDAVSIQKNGAELLHDGSFEKQWTTSHSGGMVSYVTQDGNGYLQSAVSASAATNSGARSPMIPITGGTTYMVKGKYIADNISIYIEFWSPDGTRISESHQALPAAATWTEGSISAAAPAGASHMTALFYGRVGETLYIDDAAACELKMTTPVITPEGDGMHMQAGSIASGLVPVESGKSYVASVTTKATAAGDVTMKLSYFSSSGRSLGSTTITSSTTETEILKIGSTAPMYAFTAQIELSTSQGAYFEQADMYAVTNTLSNSSFETVTLAHYWEPGNFPLQWRTFGAAAAEAVSNAELENQFGALKLFVSGRDGGVRSSYIRAEGGKKYMGRIYAKGSGGIRIAFFDKDFACVSTGEVTAFASGDYERYTASATAPETAVYATIELVANEGESFYCDNAEFTQGVVEIADNTQMFIDDYVISETDMTRTFHQGEKTEPIFKGNEDYWENDGRYIYGTVLYDEEEKIYKMWYQSSNGDYSSGGDAASVMASYATSEDGENWTKPKLGIVEYPEYAGGETSTDNNMIGNSHIMSVFIDYDAEPEQRYKMITYGHTGYYIWRYSADGINWTDGGKIHDGADVINAAQDSNGMFYGLVKYQPEILRRDQWTFVGDAVNNLETSVPANSLADVVDAKSVYHTDSYGMGFYDKDGVYIGFNWLYTLTGIPYMEGLIEPNLAFSRDLKEEWQRPTREALIPLGEEGSIDDGMIFTATSAIEMGDEIWMYCGGWDGDHGVSARDADLYIAKWRMDGFASMDAGAEEGTLTTKPLLFDGSTLKLNANAEGGAIYVELQDENGTPISGYTKADSDVIATDSVRHTVSWNGKSDVSALEGTPVTVCIYAENSEVYSFRFASAEDISMELYQDGTEIPALVSGDVDVKLQMSDDFSSAYGTVMLAVYENNELIKFVSAEPAAYQAGDTVTLRLEDMLVNENAAYRGKVFFWSDLQNMTPLRKATEYNMR